MHGKHVFVFRRTYWRSFMLFSKQALRIKRPFTMLAIAQGCLAVLYNRTIALLPMQVD